ncbi:hypothetical protein M8J77_011400 [Diaphorina citri]|nr:hypothetical protein M8J77_011400 [Diaphorina citri]
MENLASEFHSQQSDSDSQNLIQLKPISLLPPQYQSVFSEFTYFNAVQSNFVETLLETDQSVVVSAPTGSGKTVLFEMAILKLLLDVDNGVYDTIHDIKAVYISPLKSLCSEKYNVWKTKFAEPGGHQLRIAEITGDTVDQGQSSLHFMTNVHLVLTTPEKWDAMTRKWRDCASVLNQVRLLMLDEVHLLGEESRGPVLEAVVCRMRTVQKSQRASQPIRFVAVSATIPNIYDIALWLGFGKPTVYAQIDDSFRPVKLTKIVRGFPTKPSQSTFQFEMMLSYKLKSIIMQYSDNKPTLIFCATRKGVEHTCTILRQEMSIQTSPEVREIVDKCMSNMMDNKLKDMLRSSIGYHHAGMSPEDRTIIEQLFRSGYLMILVSTSSLAIGVNLPAHLVIVKSTENYVGASGYQEYKETQILQMIGRAGRPQYDTEAIAVILTKQQNQVGN